MATTTRPRYVDTSNPALAIDCPNCGLLTARFMEYCRNCGYCLWPSGEMASTAFKEWKRADPRRAAASRFDLEIPTGEAGAHEVDYEARARQLGIHIFLPWTPYPIVICVGILFLGFAGVKFGDEQAWVRISLAVIGGLIFLYGLYGWVIKEDTAIYPGDDGHEGGH